MTIPGNICPEKKDLLTTQSYDYAFFSIAFTRRKSETRRD
jgi:hypothetical protein